MPMVCSFLGTGREGRIHWSTFGDGHRRVRGEVSSGSPHTRMLCDVLTELCKGIGHHQWRNHGNNMGSSQQGCSEYEGHEQSPSAADAGQSHAGGELEEVDWVE